MAGRVEQHPPGLPGLRVGHRRAELDGSRLRRVEVLDGEVEVELLAAVLVRPGRRGVPLDPAEAQCVVGNAAAMVTVPATGASLTALIVKAAVSVAAEKAVVPPFDEVSAVLPTVPLVRSQARKVIALVIVPLKFAFGWK